MAASAILIYALKWAGILWLRKFDWKTAYALAPVVFFYNANVAFALASLKTLNLPMYHVLKRISEYNCDYAFLPTSNAPFPQLRP